MWKIMSKFNFSRLRQRHSVKSTEQLKNCTLSQVYNSCLDFQKTKYIKLSIRFGLISIISQFLGYCLTSISLYKAGSVSILKLDFVDRSGDAHFFLTRDIWTKKSCKKSTFFEFTDIFSSNQIIIFMWSVVS